MNKGKQLQRVLCTVVFVFAFTIAKAMMPADTKVTLDYKSVSVETVFQHIQKQSGLNFVYTSELARSWPKISIKATKKSAEQVISQVAGLIGCTYKIRDNIVTITRQKSSGKQRTISGYVRDEQGEPLAGVPVCIGETRVCTVTDANGFYTFNIPVENTTLKFSYVGMSTAYIAIPVGKGNVRKDITLQSNTTLDDVMVTGYQTLKREDATGAFQTISSESLNDRYGDNLSDHLEGKIAGLVNYKDQLTIRGVGTLKASSSPLVVVDGLPISGSIDDLNPYEIEKITVLKDAAAAAIYGARASNGVIVVVSKKASQEKLSIEFNADLKVRNRYNYDDLGYCNAAEQIELEKYNFDWMVNNATAYKSLMSNYKSRGNLMSPITKLMIKHHLGEISDEEYNSTINQWSKNSYRGDWQDFMEHHRLNQQYNLSIRTKGRYLNSSIVINWKGDNTNYKNQYNNTLSLQYNGIMDVCKWLSSSFGVTLINDRKKSHATGDVDYNSYKSFPEYLSMYEPDGTPARLQAAVWLGEPSLSDSSLGLKDEGYVPVEELNMNYAKSRQTYSRSFVHVNILPFDGLKLSGMFQYEDFVGRSETLLDGDSYSMRHLYNLFTKDGKHYIPDGSRLDHSSSEGNYYTFRMQATYDKIFAQKHAVSAIAGFEFRQTYSRTSQSQVYGYDDQTLTNTSGQVNYAILKTLKSTDLGSIYTSSSVFNSNDVAGITEGKHRYESYYFTANYTYDKRYSASGSYRVDKADLFGADPKFRSRPLWSMGVSWNVNNEKFMKKYTWIDMLKLRMSYGVTGNINTNYSSYLTSRTHTSIISGEKYATLNTPPNDQLRWEKTATTNVGLDVSLLRHRIDLSFDFYYKKGTDVLSNIDLDPTTGWTSLYTNNAETRNKGFEMQLSADVLRNKTPRDFGISTNFTLSFNNNKIVKLNYKPTSGYAALTSYREGDPINSLYSFAFDHIETNEKGFQQIYLRKANGEVMEMNLASTAFTVNDIVFCGSTTPKVSASFTPTLKWQRFTLSGVFVYYGGHYFRANAQAWNTSMSYSYGNAVPKCYLDYWRAEESQREGMLGNGYMMSKLYSNASYYTYFNDQNVDHADYLKLRSVVLGYNFSDGVCKSLGISALRLRLQMNNVFSVVRNKYGVDPESTNATVGTLGLTTPKSYTLSVNVKF